MAGGPGATGRAEDARQRLRSLAKRDKRPVVPLFVPVVYAAAAQIEGLGVQEFLTNATKLSKGLSAMYEITETDGIVSFSANHEVSEALGAEIDWGAYPPTVKAHPGWPGAIDDGALKRIVCHPRLETGLEAARRLKQTIRGEPVFAVVLTGPAALAAELSGSGSVWPALLEAAGRITAAISRSCGEAGINLIILAEHDISSDGSGAGGAWRSALTTVVNVVRFFGALLVVVFERADGTLASAIIREPLPGIIAGGADDTGGGLPEVHCLGARPVAWRLPTSRCSLVTTAQEIPAEQDIAELRNACLQIRLGLSGY